MMKVAQSSGNEKASLTGEGSNYAFEDGNLNFDCEEVISSSSIILIWMREITELVSLCYALLLI